MTRARGTGSITPHKGKHRARLPVEGVMKSLGLYDSYEDAEVALNQALIRRAAKPGGAATKLTFATWGKRVLDIREEEGVRGIVGERRRFRRHLETCAFASKAVADVTTADIADLARSIAKKTAADRRGDAPRKLSKKTVQRCIALTRAIFALAVQRDMRPANPCIGVTVKVGKDENVDEDGEALWDWLRADEQVAFLECADIPLWFRLMVRVAWGTGMRQGEQWNLELRDVHVARTFCGEEVQCACGEKKCIKLRERGPHIYVRWGAKNLPPKNGRTRRINLFGEGLAGMLAWLDLLPKYLKKKARNTAQLVFPTPSGTRRQPQPPQRSGPKVNGKWTKVRLLPESLAKVGITRPIRWHDLRHTCASSLVSGSWGRAWSLVQVRDMLGHSSVTVTEKYAHLAGDTLREEGNATPGHGAMTRDTLRDTNGPGGGSSMAAIINETVQVPRDGIEPPTRGFSIPEDVLQLQGVASKGVTSVTPTDASELMECLAPEVRVRIA